MIQLHIHTTFLEQTAPLHTALTMIKQQKKEAVSRRGISAHSHTHINSHTDQNMVHVKIYKNKINIYLFLKLVISEYAF